MSFTSLKSLKAELTSARGYVRHLEQIIANLEYDAEQAAKQDKAYADQHAHDVAWMTASEREAYHARLSALNQDADSTDLDALQAEVDES